MKVTHRFVKGVCVDAEPIDVPQRGWNAALSKQVHERMHSFWIIEMKVPKHGVIGHICLRMPLVAAIHGWKFDGIADEEDGKVVKDEVLDSLFCVKFGRPATNVPDGVTRTLLTTYSGDPSSQLRLFAKTGEPLGVCQV